MANTAKKGNSTGRHLETNALASRTEAARQHNSETLPAFPCAPSSLLNRWSLPPKSAPLPTPKVQQTRAKKNEPCSQWPSPTSQPHRFETHVAVGARRVRLQEERCVVPPRFPSTHLSVVRETDLVAHVRPRKLGLRLPNHGYLGDGVDACREPARNARQDSSGYVCTKLRASGGNILRLVQQAASRQP